MQSSTHHSTQQRRAWLIGLLGICLLVLNSLFLQVRSAIYYDDTTDLSASYAAAQLKSVQNDGVYSLERLQQQAAGQVHGRVRPYLYPPWFAEALSVFAGTDYVTFRIGWSLFSHLCLAALFLVTLALVKQLAGRLTVTDSLLCIAGFALFAPIERELFYGQVSLLLAVLIYLAVALYPARRDTLSGALVEAAAMFKVYPVLLLAFFLANRRYLALAGCGIFITIVTGLSVYNFGTADWSEFFHLHAGGALLEQAYSRSPAQFMSVPNHGPSHLIYLHGIALHRPVDAASALWLGRLLVVAAGLLFLWYLRSTLWPQRHTFEALVTVLAWMLLISPVLWNHVFVFLLPALILLLARALQADSPGPDLWLLLAAAVTLALADYSTNISQFNHSALVLLKPLKLYGLLSLLLYVARRIRRGDTLAFEPSRVQA